MTIGVASSLSNRLRLAIALTGLTLLGELVGGYLANSLALLSDAGHVFTDILALLLSWFAVKQAERLANHRMTYGYHRVGILVALINAVTLVAISLAIFYEAYRRLREPEPVQSILMFGVASIGLIVNLVVMFALRADQERNLNVRSAFVHVLGDALASVGVIFGGAVIYFSGWFWVDPALSVVIGLIIAFSSWQIIREAVHIFLEASPIHLDMDEVVQAMSKVPGIKDVHDLHIWTIAPQMHALSCHILVEDQIISEGAQILKKLKELLSGHFHIGHITVQFECVGCDQNELYCTLGATGEPECHYVHHH